MREKKDNVYAFIDSQNLNLGVRSLGWKLDWRKFRLYLKNKYGVSKAYLFIGHVAGNETLYTSLQESGFILIFKPTLNRREGDKTIIKGNVDAELVMHTMIQYENYHRAVLVTGDGDFFCLIEHLERNKKLLLILAPNRHYSSLLRPFSKYVVRIDRLRASLEYKVKRQEKRKTGIGGRSEP